MDKRILVILIVVIMVLLLYHRKRRQRNCLKNLRKKDATKQKGGITMCNYVMVRKILYRYLPTESEAAVAYQIATNAVLRSPVLILLKIQKQKTAKDKDWELIQTEIKNIVKGATPMKIKKLLAVLPKLKSRGYNKRKSGKFQAYIYFEGQQRNIGTFEDESEAELAYKLAHNKKHTKSIPSFYNNTTAAAIAMPSSASTLWDREDEDNINTDIEMVDSESKQMECYNEQSLFVNQYNDCTNDFSRDSDKDTQESDDDDAYVII